MGGIREAAMSENPEKEYKPKKSYFDFGENNYSGSQSHKKKECKFKPSWMEKDEMEEEKNDSLIEITLKITNKEIGPSTDYMSPLYNFDLSDKIAKTMAYDKIESMLGKGFESKYIITFDIEANYKEYKAYITLEPIKKTK